MNIGMNGVLNGLCTAVFFGVLLALLNRFPWVYDIPAYLKDGLTTLKPEEQRMRYNGYEPSADTTCKVIGVPRSSEEFSYYVMKRQPVLIRAGDIDSVFGWHTARWKNVSYLRVTAGKHSVNIEHKDAARAQIFGEHTSRQKVSFNEFLDRLESESGGAENVYMNLQACKQCLTSPPLSVLSHDITVPHFFMQSAIVAFNLWMGRADPREGTVSGLHHDYEDNIYILVQGRKRVVLYSPAELFNLYPQGQVLEVNEQGSVSYWNSLGGGGHQHPLPHFMRAQPATLTHDQLHEEYPRFFAAKHVACEVTEGDLLFIPSGWSHQVTSYGFHVAVNVWTNPYRPHVEEDEDH